MKPAELKAELKLIADQLVPVAGAIMQVSCSQPQEHDETCVCYLCRAFLATQSCTTRLEVIMKKLGDDVPDQLPREVQEIARKIGQFYLEKHKNDYAAATQELNSIRFSKIEIEPPTIKIHAAMIGRLIGKRGMNIEALEKYLGIKIKIFEDYDYLYAHLIPYPPYEDETGPYDLTHFELPPKPEDTLP